MSAGLSSAHEGASGPGCLLESSPEEALEGSGRVLKGSGLSRRLSSELARAGLRDSRWGGGARIWVHLESERIRVSVSSGGEERFEVRKTTNPPYERNIRLHNTLLDFFKTIPGPFPLQPVKTNWCDNGC